MIDTSKPTYADFRASQQTFKFDDGTIKFIDRGEGEVIVLSTRGANIGLVVLKNDKWTRS